MKLVILTVLLTALASAGFAHTYSVQPDGSGDYPTIQAAADVAVGGDVIELGSGTFIGAGNRDILVHGPDVIVRSQSGDPATCIIDCQDAGRGFFLQGGALDGTVNLEGITITRGREYLGGGVYCEFVWPVISNCVFYRNFAQRGGGFALEWGAGTFVRCRFVENAAGLEGGAFTVPDAAIGVDVTFEECQFVGNTAPSGGAVYFLAYPIRGTSFHNCSFVANSAGTGGAITLIGFSPLIDQCTFVSNYTGTGTGGAIACQLGGYFQANPDIRHCIFAFSIGGPAVSCDTGCDPTLTCSDLYGNSGGDWVGCLADQADQNGNLCADPLFCDPANQDYTLRFDSPCAPQENPACGLVGAWPVGCVSPVPVRSTSWGAVKARFR